MTNRLAAAIRSGSVVLALMTAAIRSGPVVTTRIQVAAIRSGLMALATAAIHSFFRSHWVLMVMISSAAIRSGTAVKGHHTAATRSGSMECDLVALMVHPCRPHPLLVSGSEFVCCVFAAARAHKHHHHSPLHHNK